MQMKCLEAKHMAPFPFTNKKHFADSIVSKEVFCNCRMVKNPSVHLVNGIMNAKKLGVNLQVTFTTVSVARGLNLLNPKIKVGVFVYITKFNYLKNVWAERLITRNYSFYISQIF